MFKIDWYPISIRQFDENHILKMVKETKNWMESRILWTRSHSTYLCCRCKIVWKSNI